MRPENLKFATLLLVSIALIASTGCVSKGKYNSISSERDALAQEKAALEADNSELTQERDELALVAAEQEVELAEYEEDFEALMAVFAMEIEANDIQVSRLVNGMELAIPADVMYQSGATTATLSDESRDQIMKLAEFLKESDYHISVVGHTDNQAPTGELAEKYPTNWEVAAARACSAVKFLVGQGVEATRIVAVSKGDSDPIASNETPEGRAQNRRLQVILRDLPE